jgi:signal transduction histidine kinase
MNHMTPKNLIRLSQQYEAALGKHLQRGSRARLQPALAMGRAAVALGLDTLELARMHERALGALKPANAKKASTKAAGIFFTQANTPIEETHRAARQGKAHLSRLEETLGERTEELAASNRQLQRGVARHKVMELAADKRGQHHQKSLAESLKLQRRLRQLTHRAMAAQEDQRKKISRELQDEIAQTLLGINVRLLSLKQKAQGNTKNFKRAIASTQRLVAQSARSVRLAAREMGHEQ